jgi:hypothetical protein
MILYRFAENPVISAYDISPVKRNKKSNSNYKDTRNRIKRLEDLGLIEKVTECENVPNIHKAQYHKLSTRGIYYIISNNLRLQYGQYDISINLLKNYVDHPLFQHFLYPCIEHETLLKLGDTAIFSHVFSYLYDCCKKVEETVHMINNTDNRTRNGYVTRQLFSWDNISKEDKDNLRSKLLLVLSIEII